MNISRIRYAVAIGLLTSATGFSALTALPASYAATIPGIDQRFEPVGDVAVESIPDGANAGTPAAVDQSRVIGDIYRTRIVHGTKTVRVSLKYRALPAAGQYNRHTVYIGTGKTALTIEVVAGPGNWLGTKSVRRSATPMSCPNLVSRIDYTHKMFIVQVPRTCLGNPHWVRADGFMTATVDQGARFLRYVDFGFTDGFVDGSDLSTKVYAPTVENSSGPGGLQ